MTNTNEMQVFDRIGSLGDFIVQASVRGIGAKQVVFRFPNNYGASVILGGISYGLELAVISFGNADNESFSLRYDTPIASDVVPFLDDETLIETLEAIIKLPEFSQKVLDTIV